MIERQLHVCFTACVSEEFWKRVPQPCREELKKVARPLHYKAGESVFLEGDSFRGPYVIQKGIFKIYQLNESGKEAILNFFFPGSVVAALPLLRGRQVYPASCEAVRDGSVIYLPEQKCTEFLRMHPDLKTTFQEDFVLNAEFFKNKTAIIMLHSTEERVIFFLEELGANEQEVYLNIPKNQIALYLGVTAEAFSRAFSNLKRKGRITEQDGYVRLNS